MDDNAGLRTAPRGLTRGQVAELLGIPESEVSRMDGRLLNPVRTGDRRWLYQLSELRSLLDRSNGTGGGGPLVSGDTTAAVFELFEAGKTLPQVVIATKQTAATIEHLRAAYDRMVGAMVLPAETVSHLRRVIGTEFQAHTLVKAVEAALNRMFQEGREDAADYGVVRDPKTGEMRTIPRTPLADRSPAAFSACQATGGVQPIATDSDMPRGAAAFLPGAPPTHSDSSDRSADGKTGDEQARGSG